MPDGTRGGARSGAGRKPGGLNKSTIERALRAQHGLKSASEGGLLPLDVMLARMRDELLPNGQKVTDEMFEAAVAVAPYLHARLSAVAASVTTMNPEVQASAERARRILLDQLEELEAGPPVQAETLARVFQH